jgi:hypothetical protein
MIARGAPRDTCPAADDFAAAMAHVDAALRRAVADLSAAAEAVYAAAASPDAAFALSLEADASVRFPPRSGM